MEKRVVKVRYIKNDKYAYEVEDPTIGVNSFVWCTVTDPKTKKSYQQLAIVTDVVTKEEAALIRQQLAEKKKELKSAHKLLRRNN